MPTAPVMEVAAVGSFASTEVANDLVGRTLYDNQRIVDQVVEGTLPQAHVLTRFDTKTGREAYRRHAGEKPQLRDTYAVRVVIVHDPKRKDGYSVLTAFPATVRCDRDPRGRKEDRSPLSLEIPAALSKMAVWIDFDVKELLKPRQDFIDLALSNISHEEMSAIRGFLYKTISDASPDELQEIWSCSNANIYFPRDGELRVFILQIVQRIDKAIGAPG
jgi:hypothetical protein